MLRVIVVGWLAIQLAPAWQAAGVLIPGIVREPTRDHAWFMEHDPSYREFWRPSPGDYADPLTQNPS